MIVLSREGAIDSFHGRCREAVELGPAVGVGVVGNVGLRSECMNLRLHRSDGAAHRRVNGRECTP